MFPAISDLWRGDSVLVLASGPGLTAPVARECRLARWLAGWKVLAVNDAYKVAPWADAMYAADAHWWRYHDGAQDFHGTRYTSSSQCLDVSDDKSQTFPKAFPDITLINARPGEKFSTDPNHIHYGWPEHSGFQAVNLALLLGAKLVVLVGFDYRHVAGKAHFFGDHPLTFMTGTDENYRKMAKAFDTAPCDRILNATPGSALKAYPQVTLDEALQRHDRLHWNRAESHATAD